MVGNGFYLKKSKYYANFCTLTKCIKAAIGADIIKDHLLLQFLAECHIGLFAEACWRLTSKAAESWSTMLFSFSFALTLPVPPVQGFWNADDFVVNIWLNHRFNKLKATPHAAKISWMCLPDAVLGWRRIQNHVHIHAHAKAWMNNDSRTISNGGKTSYWKNNETLP